MRDYPKKWLRKAYWRAKTSARDELLRDNVKQGSEPDIQNKSVIRCICTFDGYSKEVYQILRRHWFILRADIDLQEVLPKYPCLT